MDVFGKTNSTHKRATDEDISLTLKQAFERYGLDLIKSYATPHETDQILDLLSSQLAPETAERVRGMVLNSFDGQLSDHEEYKSALEAIVMSISESDWKYTLYKRLVDSVDKKGTQRHDFRDGSGLLGPGSMVRALKHQQALERTGGESTWQEEEAKALLSYSNPMEDKFKFLDRTPGSFMRRCKGGKQQRGNKNLTCHLVDLNAISYANIPELTRFLGGTGKILDRKKTGLCSKCQRRVRKVIKQSRWMGFLPFDQEVLYLDMRRYDVRKVSKTSVDGSEVVVSKTM